MPADTCGAVGVVVLASLLVGVVAAGAEAAEAVGVVAGFLAAAADKSMTLPSLS